MNKPPETKISKAQYKTLLRRAMDSTPIANQQSQAMQMQQVLGLGGGGSPMDMSGVSGMMQPQMPGMQPPQATPAQATPQPVAEPAQQAPTVPNIPATQGLGSLLQNAAQVWQEIEHGLGGQLWQRLASSIGNTDPDPSKSFIQAALAFQQNPEGIANDRVKQFLAALFPQQPSAVTSEGMQQQEDPLVGLISRHLE